METNKLFEGFDEARQEQYEQEIAQRYGDKELNESRRRWGSYSAQEKERIQAEGVEIYRELAARLDQDPASAEVQQIIARWHDHIRYFYEPTREIIMGLAEMYASNPDFIAVYQRFHPDLPEFLRRAILHYCRSLPAHPQLDETLAQILGDDSP